MTNLNIDISELVNKINDIPNTFPTLTPGETPHLVTDMQREKRNGFSVSKRLAAIEQDNIMLAKQNEILRRIMVDALSVFQETEHLPDSTKTNDIKQQNQEMKTTNHPSTKEIPKKPVQAHGNTSATQNVVTMPKLDPTGARKDLGYETDETSKEDLGHSSRSKEEKDNSDVLTEENNDPVIDDMVAQMNSQLLNLAKDI